LAELRTRFGPSYEKFVVAENVTLDGMVAEPDGGMNFLMKYLDEDMARWIATHQNQWDTLLMAAQRGRRQERELLKFH